MSVIGAQARTKSTALRARMDTSSKGAGRWAGRIRLFPAVGLALAAGLVVAFAAYGFLRWITPVDASKAAAEIDVTRVALTVVAGVGGVVALVIAYRRQRDLEQSRFVERFGAAAAQLGATDVAVRIAGVYAMAGVADESDGLHRQQCIDVLCGYLRLPYSPELGGNHQTKHVQKRIVGGDAGEDEDHFEYRQNDHEVRATIVRVIADHLRPDAEYRWSTSNFDFRTAHLEDVDFNHAVFVGSVRFEKATFSGYASFDEATFSDHAWFGYTTFSGGATFNQATFSGGATFANATFSGHAWLGYTTFSGGATFNQATFSGGATFDYTTFSGYAWFSHATFSDASFRNATFSDASFSDATFRSDASFSDASFGNASFRGATFSGNAAFGEAMFKGDIWFEHAKFRGDDASFGNASFRDASFRDATFSGNASFANASFRRDTSFANATFSRSAWFINATFSGNARFDDATLNGETSFVAASFSDGTSFEGVVFAGQTGFQSTDFGSGRVVFTTPRQWGPPPPEFDWGENGDGKPANIEPTDWPPALATSM
ncbi:pentapeptide repeat-containing protein [Nocardia sp. bgisy134]|uniref:pentapeptide repeat-containing protein n=1 Tax=Nocardia sp. bgisy134 TaxID=3413789 RepID=UPI003D75E4DF